MIKNNLSSYEKSEIIREIVAEENDNKTMIVPLCIIFGISKDTYYRNIKYDMDPYISKNYMAALAVKTVYEKNHCIYGFRKVYQYLVNYNYTLELEIYDELTGVYTKKEVTIEKIGRDKVKKLLRIQAIIGHQEKKKTHYDIATERTGNILQRRFKNIEEPNKYWVSDVTYLNFKNTRLYLIPIIDLYDGSVVSYKVSRTQKSKDIIDVVKEAIVSNELKNLVFHTDCETQYTSEKTAIF